MVQWEYATQTLAAVGIAGADVLCDRLAHLGDQGWELVVVLPVGSSATLSHSTYVFKRPKVDPAEVATAPLPVDESRPLIDSTSRSRAA